MYSFKTRNPYSPRRALCLETGGYLSEVIVYEQIITMKALLVNNNNGFSLKSIYETLFFHKRLTYFVSCCGWRTGINHKRIDKL